MHLLLIYYWGDGSFLLAVFSLVTERCIDVHLTMVVITVSESRCAIIFAQ